MDEIPTLLIPQIITIFGHSQSFIHKLFNPFSNKVLSFQLSFNPNFQYKHIMALIVQKNPNLPKIPYTIKYTSLKVPITLHLLLLYSKKSIKINQDLFARYIANPIKSWPSSITNVNDLYYALLKHNSIREKQKNQFSNIFFFISLFVIFHHSTLLFYMQS